jgi:hypothetical protein|tara:strand:+ start:391 stop:1323 length:933 start_codon:yes stop_codon:yes gene_type:complete
VLQFLIPALTTLAVTKYAANTRNDPKAPIGSGTAPTLQPGGDIQVTPVEGSDVQDFGDFETENIAEPQNLTEEEQLMMMLQEAGVDLEGLASLALGGAVQNKSNGGILDILGLSMDDLTSPEGINFDEIEPMDPSSPDALEISMDQNELKPSIGDMSDPEVGQEQTGIQKVLNIAATDPELFQTGVGSLTKVLATLMTDKPERKGSMVRTQTLPGNSTRRRSAQMNIQPIGGSKVTFANQGKALQRPMFMPHGGQMRGPGGPKDDLIPVMASNGEYMLSKAAVDAAGGGSHAKGLARLDAFNKMGNKRYG